MRILVIGSGGREHALVWAISRSPLVDALFCAPGNAGIAQEATCLPVAAEDIDGILALCEREKIDFVVVGPEGPLVAGVVDRLAEKGIPAFGPGAAAAQLEGSKAFTKELCARMNIPTAGFGRYSDPAAAKVWVREHGKLPVVVKADGLAAGKGVVIAETLEAADAAIDDALEGGRFGAAGHELVLEEFLTGVEASFFVLCDGKNALPLVSAQDHKRVFDGDEGPNTGGMGAYSPAPMLTAELEAQVMKEIIYPTLVGMADTGMPYKGVLYAGLMLTETGPQLIEYNARFGDPETQVLMTRLKSDILPAFIASHDGVLDDFALQWKDEVALTVVMAADGYPGDYARGTVIKGIEAANALPGVKVFHAGTKAGPNGEILANGGRVLNVTATGATIAEAQKRAYQAVDLIDWPEGFCRRDIGWRAV
ncbi:phosphoribosylamine--glycine ligase [Radicibacter daui]|uniref:phosphoribosylamine--glycine ligase n=1 Tax=Radicibacter daui TaxID=3064829 RepID=UPI0040470230